MIRRDIMEYSDQWGVWRLLGRRAELPGGPLQPEFISRLKTIWNLKFFKITFISKVNISIVSAFWPPAALDTLKFTQQTPQCGAGSSVTQVLSPIVDIKSQLAAFSHLQLYLIIIISCSHHRLAFFFSLQHFFLFVFYHQCDSYQLNWSEWRQTGPP